MPCFLVERSLLGVAEHYNEDLTGLLPGLSTPTTTYSRSHTLTPLSHPPSLVGVRPTRPSSLVPSFPTSSSYPVLPNPNTTKVQSPTKILTNSPIKTAVDPQSKVKSLTDHQFLATKNPDLQSPLDDHINPQSLIDNVTDPQYPLDSATDLQTTTSNLKNPPSQFLYTTGMLTKTLFLVD